MTISSIVNSYMIAKKLQQTIFLSVPINLLIANAVTQTVLVFQF